MQCQDCYTMQWESGFTFGTTLFGAPASLSVFQGAFLIGSPAVFEVFRVQLQCFIEPGLHVFPSRH